VKTRVYDATADEPHFEKMAKYVRRYRGCFESEAEGWKHVSKRLVKMDKMGEKLGKILWEIKLDIQYDVSENEFESYRERVDKGRKGTENDEKYEEQQQCQKRQRE
jgi:hypothetical protein